MEEVSNQERGEMFGEPATESCETGRRSARDGLPAGVRRSEAGRDVLLESHVVTPGDPAGRRRLADDQVQVALQRIRVAKRRVAGGVWRRGGQIFDFLQG